MLSPANYTHRTTDHFLPAASLEAELLVPPTFAVMPSSRRFHTHSTSLTSQEEAERSPRMR
eukprot:761149-Hanusia_phi.AAC.3